jgi:hypothetical protein
MQYLIFGGHGTPYPNSPNSTVINKSILSIKYIVYNIHNHVFHIFLLVMKQALQNDTSVSIAGSYQTMKEVKRKENWKKLCVKLEKGILTVHKNLKVSYCLNLCFIHRHSQKELWGLPLRFSRNSDLYKACTVHFY